MSGVTLYFTFHSLRKSVPNGAFVHTDYTLQQLEDPEYYFCLHLAYWEKKMQKNTWGLAQAKSRDLLKSLH